jgi:hypothetical protein
VISFRRAPTGHLPVPWSSANQFWHIDDRWAICQANLNHAEILITYHHDLYPDFVLDYLLSGVDVTVQNLCAIEPWTIDSSDLLLVSRHLLDSEGNYDSDGDYVRVLRRFLSPDEYTDVMKREFSTVCRKIIEHELLFGDMVQIAGFEALYMKDSVKVRTAIGVNDKIESIQFIIYTGTKNPHVEVFRLFSESDFNPDIARFMEKHGWGHLQLLYEINRLSYIKINPIGPDFSQFILCFEPIPDFGVALHSLVQNQV